MENNVHIKSRLTPLIIDSYKTVNLSDFMIFIYSDLYDNIDQFFTNNTLINDTLIDKKFNKEEKDFLLHLYENFDLGN